jgi:ubiquinol-cytochrome c reductase iron-sulfur subunit
MDRIEGMSEQHGHAGDGDHSGSEGTEPQYSYGHPPRQPDGSRVNDDGVRVPGEAELAEMSRDDLVKLGARLDGVELVHYEDPWPVRGTRAEKRAERHVALWFAFAGLAGLAFIVIFFVWPWRYNAPPNQGAYEAYTPLLGLTLGLTLLGFAGGVLSYTKSFLPAEVAVQQRHDGASEQVDRATVMAELADAGNRSTIARRSLIKKTAGAAVGMLGIGLVVFPISGFVRNPWGKRQPRADTLAYTPWHHGPDDEKVFLRKYTGSTDPTDVQLVKPGDMDAGAMQTVFPFRESDRNNPDKLQEVFDRVDTPVMLIRFRPEDAQQVVPRKGQEGFNYGTFYAYSKICTHLGCPCSLYEQESNVILCPCHQSQFDALHWCSPIFGPAARALPQLPIGIDDETGYLVSPHGFIEPVGPGYWERGA